MAMTVSVGLAIVGVMSSASTEPDGVTLPPPPLAGATPGEIRAALHPQYREAFDRDDLAALAEAGRTLDLAGVHDRVEHWRRRSWTTRDRQEHRRVMRRAVELLTGQQPPADQPVWVTEASL
jgi:hypothetical protein